MQLDIKYLIAFIVLAVLTRFQSSVSAIRYKGIYRLLTTTDDLPFQSSVSAIRYKAYTHNVVFDETLCLAVVSILSECN